MQPALAWRLGGILPVQGRRVDSVGLGRSMSIFASSFLRAFLRSRRGRTSSVSLCSTRDLNAAAARRFARQRSARRFEPVLSRTSIRLRDICRRATHGPGTGVGLRSALAEMTHSFGCPAAHKEDAACVATGRSSGTKGSRAAAALLRQKCGEASGQPLLYSYSSS